jgi:hypothetical protein
MALGLNQPLTEMNIRKSLGVGAKAASAKADNLTAIREPIV